MKNLFRRHEPVRAILVALSMIVATPVFAQTGGLPPGCIWINQTLGWYQCGNDIHRGIVADEVSYRTSPVAGVTDVGRRAN